MTTPRIAIIGAGFGGLCAAVRLRQAGITSFTLFEKGSDVGGVWRANTYPGAACDVPSHLYEFSFAPNPRWSRRFAGQREIHAYQREVARRHGLYAHLRTDTEIASARFAEEDGVWHLTTTTGEVHEAEVLITATGQLSRPSIPPIPGRESFAGPQFHSATWRHDVDPAGKRVAVLGTGASAIQFVPEVAEAAEAVTVFQLDPPHVLPKSDYPYPRAATAVFSRVPAVQRLSRWLTYWQLESRALAFTRWPWLAAPFARRVTRHLKRKVTDESLRRRIAPTSPLGCTRVLLSNNWYGALDRPHVDVVTERVTEVRPEGLVTEDGRTREFDVLIYGTGFRATDFLAPMEITGRDGRELNQAWRDGAEAYLGMTVSGFPNLFMLYGPNTNLGHSSIIFMLESQTAYVLQAVRELSRGRTRWLDVRPEVLGRFNDEVQRRIRATVWDRGCTSWYKNAAGKNTVNWPGFTFAYRRRTRRLELDDFHREPARTGRPM
ncbi:NAD(P)/FAD-dependent oxidoreductase [Streptomyces sp. NA04227]|uniref:flavin-containing monooxygenase n=1 Tax=Streptomyces sp. NA04227 TaxID=2742136 RepID=UPI00159186AD|nr:NAD(P)/FAD-dependent oxidoreductase [Streptomyces sp. NA04227]QKW07539.1 NAD(P)/FAD-dependent oxidoreductase [Streptomyces sp. NA04227]